MQSRTSSTWLPIIDFFLLRWFCLSTSSILLVAATQDIIPPRYLHINIKKERQNTIYASCVRLTSDHLWGSTSLIELVPGLLCSQHSYMRHITRWLRDLIPWIKNFDIDVCMRTSTHITNSDRAMNFTQGCFSIALSIASISLCLYSCPYSFLRLCMSVGVLILYCFVLMSLCGWWFIA
jgi:hypothetical protein